MDGCKQSTKQWTDFGHMNKSTVGANHRLTAYVETASMDNSIQQVHSSFIHSFILDISIAPLQVHYYSEAILTTALISKALQATTIDGLAEGPYMLA